MSICLLIFIVLGFFDMLIQLISAKDLVGALFHVLLIGLCLGGGYFAIQMIIEYWPNRTNQYMPDQAEKLGLCPRCNYSMRGWSASKCPECGMALGVSENEIKRYDA